jgi:transcriptional regulator with AAA-type ATPase domain
MTSLLGDSPQVSAVREQIARLVAHHAAASRRLPPVLIQGETGTGKGLVAHLLHERGSRASAAFVDVNCAAIPETLLEAELFGFERGAFTDARQAKAGLLQTAHRGTIFLDEIGLMPDALQVKLLKALEERVVRRLGSTRAEPVDAWVVAATSENLSAAIRDRRFREDLYHRLAVVTLQLPPLRERSGDVLLLARHYLSRVCADYGLPAKALTAGAEAALSAYPWPGNVRELANVMERVALLSDTREVSAAALALSSEPPTAAAAARTEGVDAQTAALERTRIEEALHAEGWNISRTAARLGLARNTLRYRMERHGFVESGGRRRRGIERPQPIPEADASQPSDHAPPQPPVQWRRMRVTFLKADVPGDGGDGPDEHLQVRRAEELAAKASSFGGRIIDLGSSVTAAFGLSLVEDAAHHAAHAALAMQRSVLGRGAAPRVRVALHTAETLVGRLDDRVEVDADGRRAAEAVLAGLLASAAADSIVASPDTRTLLERRFELEGVQGVSGAQTSWRVRGLLSVDPSSGPFVSRDRELAVLEDLLARAEGGLGQAVLLAGDPGIGKSRLLRELRRRTRGRADWLEGTALSFGGSMPFHPLIDLLKQAFAIQASDSDRVIGDRIDRATARFGESFRPSAQFLRALLGVDASDPALTSLDPKLRRAGILDALRQFLLGTAEHVPLVVVLEDAHWMDQATAEFLPLLVDGLGAGRILLCVTQRTGFSLPGGEGIFGTRLTIPRVPANSSS